MHYIQCVGGHVINAGNLSYTVPLPVGRRNQMCKIEVHIKSKAYRITSPKVQFPQTAWCGDPVGAWEIVKGKCLEALQGAAAGGVAT